MRLEIHPDEVPLRVWPQGEVRVGKTRVFLDQIVYHFNEGARPEEIVEMFDTLEVADVYAVIAYYLRHRAEVDEFVRWRDEEGERLRREHLARYPQDGIKERLLARLEEMKKGQADAAAPDR